MQDFKTSVPSTRTEQLLPLAGLRVLDFSQFLAGPSAALRLADLGAEVVKIERPEGGDLSRQLIVSELRVDGQSTIFHAINRNKKGYAADLKNADDMIAVRSLVARADVLIQNFRPGVMDRLGMGYDEVRQLNPRIVYGSISGYGEQGPWRDKPGQDLLAQSLSGMPWLNGDAAQAPTPIGVGVADILTGAHLVQGILAALVRRSVTGQGGRVDVSLLESILDLQFEQFSTYLNGDGSLPQRSAVRNASVFLQAPYGIYPTADGFIAIAMTPVDRLAALVDCVALAPYVDASTWFRERDAIKRILAEHLAQKTSAQWLALLEPADVWCAEVLDWERLMRHDGFIELDMLLTTVSRHGTPFRTTRCPIRIDGSVLRSQRSAPEVGEHNDAVCRSWALGS